MSFSIKTIQIPTKPGCYLYKDKSGQVIYVGKAKVLRNRVLSYFQNKQLDSKTKLLVSKIADVEFVITSSELEALLLEQSLIHRYNPKYNIDLKGSIRYAYIKLTDESYPRLITSRKIDNKGEYFGPYTDGSARKNIMSALIKIFKVRTCVKMPKKACLQYHIGNCQAPCEDKISRETYLENIAHARMFLRGQTQPLLLELTREMKRASDARQFEVAKMYRDQIRMLEGTYEKQSVDQARLTDQDVLAWVVDGAKIHFQLLTIMKGVIASRHNFTLDSYEGVVEDFVRHFYSIHEIPQELIVQETLQDTDMLLEYLKAMKQKKHGLSYVPRVEVTVPSKGAKVDLLKLVKLNIAQTLGVDAGVTELQKKLRLTRPPFIIDFFDISNLRDQYIVGACIRLRNGEYSKKEYRKFKVRTTQTQDDFASMQEVVARRYNDAMQKNEELPDLIVIDGGRGQLNAALGALTFVALGTPVVSLAKREEEIYVPGAVSPLRYEKSNIGLRLLMKGRDEVHRFVISFNRSLRRIKN
ncbi:excinuclease ABC subunit UvrC [Candidatus Falkowbacteria bacterium]|nr:excinuclease ABC subunit UvrC [Candidatus Falkowbacteria bacterium]